MVEGVLVLGGTATGAVLVGVCFLGRAEADCKLGEMVDEEEAVGRDEGLAELGFGHKDVEGEGVVGVGLVEKTEPDVGA